MTNSPLAEVTTQLCKNNKTYMRSNRFFVLNFIRNAQIRQRPVTFIFQIQTDLSFDLDWHKCNTNLIFQITNSSFNNCSRLLPKIFRLFTSINTIFSINGNANVIVISISTNGIGKLCLQLIIISMYSYF